jgi:hypothetical protein
MSTSVLLACGERYATPEPAAFKIIVVNSDYTNYQDERVMEGGIWKRPPGAPAPYG